MKVQNYKNHIQYYPLHHFVWLPLSFILTAVCAICIFRYPAQQTMWIFFTSLAFLLLFSGVMMRQHYALGNQNRIVRLEMRLRYFQLTGNRIEPYEEQLGFGRIAALRFASDDELPALLQRALQDNLSAADIKKAIKNWHADWMRV